MRRSRSPEPSPDEGWSAPDRDGVCTRILDVGAKSTLRGRRLRRAECVQARSHIGSTWPEDFRVLLRDWLTQAEVRTQFATLLKRAGNARQELAQQLYDELLRAGCIEVEERRVSGVWRPVWVTFLEVEALRSIAGLPDRGRALERIRELQGRALHASDLAPLHASIARLPIALGIRRMELLLGLDAWISERRFGTRRDFALHVTGETKGIAESDWNWLEQALDLEDHGIRRHVPLLTMRAPWRLHGVGTMDLHGVPDCIGLSQRTLAAVERIEGSIESWCVVENRTLFDRVAEGRGDREAVLWLPGNPPTWWLETVAGLLELCPAPARIACDPDPAGIQIAMAAASLWEKAQLPWSPWMMDVESLQSLPKRRALKDQDDAILERLRARDLPEQLSAIAEWMREHRLKGEQEGLTLQALG